MIEKALKKMSAICVKPSEEVNEWRGKVKIQSTVHEGRNINYTEAFKHIYKELGYKLK